MSEPTINAALSPAEWRLIESLRGLPGEALGGRAPQVLDCVLYYLRNSRCEGMGVDGFPCGEPAAACEECHEIWDLLERLAQRFAKG